MSSLNETESPIDDKPSSAEGDVDEQTDVKGTAANTQPNTEAAATNSTQSPESVSAEESKTTAANPSFSEGEYAQHITYDDNGEAIYTDPATKYQYQFDNKVNQWLPLDPANKPLDSGNQYENEYYRWCHETNQWILKDTAKNSETENEFYKWDAEKNQWMPKTASGENIASEFKDGVHTYTDKDGVVFFWDEKKNAWFPKIDDDFMAIYQLNYGFIDNTSADGSGPSSKVSNAPEVETEEDTPKETQPKAGNKRKPEPPSK